MVPLRIPASSASGFHWLLDLVVLRELKRWYVIVGGEVADRGDCETGEQGIRKAWWEPLVLVLVVYGQVLVID